MGGEADAGSVELLIDTLVDIQEDVPVGLVCRPSTDDNVHAAGTERQEGDGVVGGLEDACVGLDDAAQEVASAVEVLIVLDTDGPFDTADILVRVVDDVVAAEETVGDEGCLVVGRQYLGVEEADGLDRTVSTLRRDEVAELKGLGDDDDDPTSQILQLATESHTDSQTHRGQDSGEGYGLHAEHTSQEEEEGDVQYRSEDRVKE